MQTDTMEILGCHPLYDHNNAFDKDIIKNPEIPYLFNQKMSMKEAAQYAIKHVDFHFTEKINKKDFLTTEQYDSFMKRTKELNIQYKKRITISRSRICKKNIYV